MKKENTTYDMYNRIKNILDTDYFHIYVELKNNDIKWSIYYKNLPYNKYFSKENTELLSSSKNSFEDIYKLDKKFKKEKQKKFSENIKEFISIDYPTFKAMNKARNKFGQFIIDFLLLIVIANIFNLFILRNMEFSFLSFLLEALGTIFLIIKQQDLDKEIERQQKNIKENFIKQKIKREGIYFMKKLKGGY